MMSRRWRAGRPYAQIVLGTFLTAVGINGFYVPNHLSDGGVAGLGIVVLAVTGIPLWLTLAVVNLPLLWLSHRWWGGRVSLRTLFGTAMLALWVGMLRVRPITHHLLLATIYGALFSGVGLGLVFRAKGTTGGTDVLARVLSHLLPISVGQAMLAVDFMVIAAFGVVFNPADAMYSLVALFISTQAIDVVQEGIAFARAFTIVSQRAPVIAETVLTDLGRGVTVVPARGGFTGAKTDVLYVVVLRSEVTRLKELVYRVDPQAFVVVTTVHEVIGEGFRRPPIEE
jgi:uncharacterized membrane-anchored protein YitT (DUF2179 family)